MPLVVIVRYLTYLMVRWPTLCSCHALTDSPPILVVRDFQSTPQSTIAPLLISAGCGPSNLAAP